MKKKIDYTDSEKIKMFDGLYDEALDEINAALDEHGHEKEYFWEDVIRKLLSMDEKDWATHNNGHKLGIEQYSCCLCK